MFTDGCITIMEDDNYALTVVEAAHAPAHHVPILLVLDDKYFIKVLKLQCLRGNASVGVICEVSDFKKYRDIPGVFRVTPNGLKGRAVTHFIIDADMSDKKVVLVFDGIVKSCMFFDSKIFKIVRHKL